MPFLKNQMKQEEWTVPDYDAVVSYWMYDPSDVGKVVADPDWLELEKDAPTFTNQRVGHLWCLAIKRWLSHLMLYLSLTCCNHSHRFGLFGSCWKVGKVERAKPYQLTIR